MEIPADGRAGSDTRYDLEDRLIEFAVTIYQLIERLPRNRVGRHISDQLLRSATSAAPNYAEARGGESRRAFIHKLRICLKELRESLVWLKLIDRLGLLEGAALDSAIHETGELTAIFARSVMTASRDSQSDTACPRT